jgi:hypothetical protein
MFHLHHFTGILILTLLEKFFWNSSFSAPLSQRLKLGGQSAATSNAQRKEQPLRA